MFANLIFLSLNNKIEFPYKLHFCHHPLCNQVSNFRAHNRGVSINKLFTFPGLYHPEGSGILLVLIQFISDAPFFFPSLFYYF